MNMVIPDEGKTVLLERCFTNFATLPDSLSIRLYANDYTPVDGSTSTDFTEASFDGYSFFTIGAADFAAAVIVSAVAELLATVTPVYSCTGGSPQTVYGWFALGLSTAVVYMAQRFDSPRLMVPGSTETLDPFKVKLKTLD